VTPLQRHPFAARFLVAAGFLFVLSAVWSLSSPVPSGPDEEAQLVKAAAVARGTLIGTPITRHDSDGVVLVSVPTTIRSAERQTVCDYLDVYVPACHVHLRTSSKLEHITTYEGRYPPLYYLVTGLPTLVSSSAWVLHAMRLVSTLVVALLLGLAFACVATYGRSGLLTFATGLIVTPTVVYLGAVVNPSASEVAGGIAMWAALTVIVMHRSEDPPKVVVVSAVIGSVAMCASRPLSTFFYALIIVSFVLLRPAACRALIRLRRMRIALVVSLAFAFVSGLWVLFAKSYELEAFPIAKQTTKGYILADLGHGERVLRQSIGSFGAPNFSVPVPILAIWLVTGFGIILAAVVLATRRDAIVVAALTVALGFVLPFAIIYSHIQTDGVIWQGRYSLPIIAGLPLLSAAVIAERYPDAVAVVLRRAAPIAIAAFAVGQIGAFYWFLRRYTVGLATDRANAFTHVAGAWTPPLPAPVLFAVAVVAAAAFELWLLRQVLTAPRPDAPTGAGVPRHRRTPVPT
jgi:hypothetical protein